MRRCSGFAVGQELRSGRGTPIEEVIALAAAVALLALTSAK
jgi:hypothetical protein